MGKLFSILVILLMAIVIPQVLADEYVYLGVLEHVASQKIHAEKSFQGHFLTPDVSVRVCFNKSGNEWVVAKNYPPKMSWTVAFDGKKIGTISSVNLGKPEDMTHYNIGRQEVVEKEVPMIGKLSNEWSGMMNNLKSLRPLITISKPNFSDPERWKRSKLSSELIKKINTTFRQTNPNVENCKNLEANAKSWNYSDSNIKIKKVYGSQNKWFAVQVQLEPYSCDGFQDTPSFELQWYAISPALDISYLGYGLLLLDAGDYDGDGESELVFKIDRYNRGGYEIFYNKLSKHVALEFSYH